MRIHSIASGSSGNCIYVGNENTHLLIDAGISGKKIEEGLNQIGLSTKDISGILVTHEHSDHIKGLGVVLRKHDIPVYSAKETISAMLSERKLGKVDESLFKDVKSDETFEIDNLSINPFNVYHDAANPYAYRISDGNKAMAVATDTGKFDEYIVDNLKNLDAILIEANHDIRMLQTGNYPYVLKRRILSDFGHLCNEACGRLLDKILHPRLKHIYLGHLSHENNYPDLAFESVRMEINLSESCFKAEDFDIKVAKRDMPSIPIEV